MKNKNITIDDLAIMVKKGFDGVDKRFDGVDKRFEAIDKRFDGVDKRFDKVEKRLDRIEKLILADHKERIEKLEMEVKELKALLV
jgi:archaellum component FlaC